jgi:hypothetical protein
MTGSALPAGLATRRFTPLHDAWLPKRERALIERLRTLPRAPLRVLLLNATKGRQFHPSITDFFKIWSHVCPGVEVTSASYFPEIHELHEAVVAKGMRTIAPGAAVDGIDSYDVVLAIGTSDALTHLIGRPGLRAKLVLLDLAFRHQDIEATGGRVFDNRYRGPAHDQGVNAVVCYSCQPESKVRVEHVQLHPQRLFTYRWFEYIPIGYRHLQAYRADAPLFDVALLGTDGREYEQLERADLAGLRVVFVGNVERAPAIGRIAAHADLTIASSLTEPVYACVVAASRLVVLPLRTRCENVLLSVVDAFAAGIPVVASRRDGFARLDAAGAPIALANGGSELVERTRALLDDEPTRLALGARAATFAREHLDIYVILERIVREQMIR